jgi:hypothetical protein
MESSLCLAALAHPLQGSATRSVSSHARMNGACITHVHMKLPGIAWRHGRQAWQHGGVYVRCRGLNPASPSPHAHLQPCTPRSGVSTSVATCLSAWTTRASRTPSSGGCGAALLALSPTAVQLPCCTVHPAAAWPADASHCSSSMPPARFGCPLDTPAQPAARADAAGLKTLLTLLLHACTQMSHGTPPCPLCWPWAAGGPGKGGLPPLPAHLS